MLSWSVGLIFDTYRLRCWITSSVKISDRNKTVCAVSITSSSTSCIAFSSSKKEKKMRYWHLYICKMKRKKTLTFIFGCTISLVIYTRTRKWKTQSYRKNKRIAFHNSFPSPNWPKPSRIVHKEFQFLTQKKTEKTCEPCN